MFLNYQHLLTVEKKYNPDVIYVSETSSHLRTIEIRHTIYNSQYMFIKRRTITTIIKKIQSK